METSPTSHRDLIYGLTSGRGWGWGRIPVCPRPARFVLSFLCPTLVVAADWCPSCGCSDVFCSPHACPSCFLHFSEPS